MTDQNPDITTRKVSVTFERKLDLGDYSNVVGRAWVEDNVSSEATDAQVNEVLVDLFNTAKSAVYDTLGIEVIVENGVIREKHEPTVSVKRAADKVGSTMGTNGGLKIMNPDDMPEGEIVPADVVEKCHELGITAVWYNTGKFGSFYKEAVAKGESPKLPDPKNPSRGGIIRPDK